MKNKNSQGYMKISYWYFFPRYTKKSIKNFPTYAFTPPFTIQVVQHVGACRGARNIAN